MSIERLPPLREKKERVDYEKLYREEELRLEKEARRAEEEHLRKLKEAEKEKKAPKLFFDEWGTGGHGFVPYKGTFDFRTERNALHTPDSEAFRTADLLVREIPSVGKVELSLEERVKAARELAKRKFESPKEVINEVEAVLTANDGKLNEYDIKALSKAFQTSPIELYKKGIITGREMIHGLLFELSERIGHTYRDEAHREQPEFEGFDWWETAGVITYDRKALRKHVKTVKGIDPMKYANMTKEDRAIVHKVLSKEKADVETLSRFCEIVGIEKSDLTVGRILRDRELLHDVRDEFGREGFRDIAECVYNENSFIGKVTTKGEFRLYCISREEPSALKFAQAMRRHKVDFNAYALSIKRDTETSNFYVVECYHTEQARRVYGILKHEFVTLAHARKPKREITCTMHVLKPKEITQALDKCDIKRLKKERLIPTSELNLPMLEAVFLNPNYKAFELSPLLLPPRPVGVYRTHDDRVFSEYCLPFELEALNVRIEPRPIEEEKKPRLISRLFRRFKPVEKPVEFIPLRVPTVEVPVKPLEEVKPVEVKVEPVKVEPEVKEIEVPKHVAIGNICTEYGVTEQLFRIDPELLKRHVCIIGATGSGKSMTAKIMVHELAKARVPTVVLDRVGEYTRLEEPEARTLRVGENFQIAPFELKPERDLGEQIEDWMYLMDHYFTTTFGAPITALQGRIMREALYEHYSQTKETLTLSKLIEKLKDKAKFTKDMPQGWTESAESVISRLQPLTVGRLKAIFDQPRNTLKPEELLAYAGLTIIDLSPLGDDKAKNLVSHVANKRFYNYVKSIGESEKLRLVYVVDEAQHLAPKIAQTPAQLGLLERYAVELRKYGIGLMAIASRPSMLSDDIKANAHIHIIHHLIHPDDLVEASRILTTVKLSEETAREKIAALDTGRALVKVSVKEHPEPVEVRMGTSAHKELIEKLKKVEVMPIVVETPAEAVPTTETGIVETPTVMETAPTVAKAEEVTKETPVSVPAEKVKEPEVAAEELAIFEKVREFLNIEPDELNRMVEKKREKRAGLLTKEAALLELAHEHGMDVSKLGIKVEIPKLKLRDIPAGLKSVTLEGELIWDYPMKDTKGGKLKMLVIRDESGEMKVKCWKEIAELVEENIEKLRKAKMVVFKGAYTDEYKGFVSGNVDRKGRIYVDGRLLMREEEREPEFKPAIALVEESGMNPVKANPGESDPPKSKLSEPTQTNAEQTTRPKVETNSSLKGKLKERLLERIAPDELDKEVREVREKSNNCLSEDEALVVVADRLGVSVRDLIPQLSVKPERVNRVEKEIEPETEYKPVFKLIIRVKKECEVSLPSRLFLKNMETGVINSVEVASEEYEKFADGKLILENTEEVGTFGEKLVRQKFSELYPWKDAPEKLYTLVRPKGGKPLDILMAEIEENGYPTYHFIEVRTITNSKSPLRLERAKEILNDRVKEFLDAMASPHLRVKKHIVIVDLSERRKWLPRERINTIVKEGFNMIWLRKFPFMQLRIMQALKLKEEGLSDEEIAKKFGVKKETIYDYISKARHLERYKKWQRNYYKQYHKRFRKKAQ